MKSKTNYKINRLLFFIVLVFMIFDGIRSNLVFGSYLSFVREGSFFLLLLLLLSKTKIKIPYISKYNTGPFLFYHGLMCLITLILPGYVQFGLLFKPFSFVIAIWLFYYYEEMTGNSYNDLFTTIIKIMAVFVVVDIVFNFIRLPIFTSRQWWGRISCGYPTMDVITLAYGIIILLFYRGLKFNTIRRTVYLLILFAGFIVQFTGTGIVVLSAIMLAALLFYVKTSDKHNFRHFSYFLLVVVVCSNSAILYVQRAFPEEYESGVWLLENKIGILLGEDTDVNTLDFREQQFADKYRKSDAMEKLIGISMVNVATGDTKAKNVYMVEDQYGFLRLCYGYIGLILFCIMVASMFWFYYKLSAPLSIKFLLYLSVVIFAANCKTLMTMILFPNYMFFALFASYALTLKRKVKAVQ